MKLTFELIGEMPLIMHADDVEASDALQAWRKDPANKNLSVPGDDRSPAWTWQTALYSDGEHVAMPSQNIMVALRQAGAQMIMKRQKTYKEISQSGLLITSEFCEFRCRGKQLPITEIDWSVSRHGKAGSFAEQCERAESLGFKLFAKRAKIGTSKHIRVRPRFDDWFVKGSISIMAPELNKDIVQQLFEIAGRVGLCDWRPGCKTPGPYGMFSAKLKAA